ncbi:MAG: DUF4377 domain-containing protein [Paracoccus sp. (in: a-proteobacteria)]
MKRILFASILTIPLILGACAQTPDAAAGKAGTTAAARADMHADLSESPLTPSVLSGYGWRLTEAVDREGRPVEALRLGLKRPLRLTFSDDRLSVQGGCNMQSGSYALQAGTLQVGQLIATRRACLPALMQLDAWVSRHLNGRLVSRIQGNAAAPRLMLTTAGGDALTFTGEPTPETRYGGPGEVLFLEVAPERVVCGDPLTRNARCLRARERSYDAAGALRPPAADWLPMYESIEGYQHRDGVRTILRVKRFKDPNPPADRSSRVYILDKVVQRGG